MSISPPLKDGDKTPLSGLHPGGEPASGLHPGEGTAVSSAPVDTPAQSSIFNMPLSGSLGGMVRA